MRRLRSLVIGALVAATLGLGSGWAYAFVNSSGSGAGVATVAKDPPITMVAATATPDSLLVPGQSADLTMTLDNPNDFAVQIISIAPDPTRPVTATGGEGECTNTGVAVDAQTGLDVVVASGDGVVVHLPHAVSMGTNSESGCQGATFNVPVLITVRQG